MKFEYIILLIIAFNVLSAVIRKRKAEPEAPPVPPRPAGARDEARGPSGRGEGVRSEGGGKEGGFGRDLLEQLAKELGLETGPDNAGRPKREVPVTVTYVPEAVPRGTEALGHSAGRAERMERAAPVAAKRAATPEPVRVRAASVDLRSREALGRAFIAKEILDPPLSRRPRR